MTALAHKMALIIKQANPAETHSVEVMQYALVIILNTLSIIISSLLAGWMTDKLASTVLAIGCLMLLRFLSGGSHMSTTTGCYIVSVALCAGIPHLPDVGETGINAMTAASSLIMVLFAPNPDKNSRLRKEWLLYLKLLSILLISMNFIILSPIMGWAFIIQALTIIPWRREAQ
jgi:accessory gene regulator B